MIRTLFVLLALAQAQPSTKSTEEVDPLTVTATCHNGVIEVASEGIPLPGWHQNHWRMTGNGDLIHTSPTTADYFTSYILVERAGNEVRISGSHLAVQDEWKQEIITEFSITQGESCFAFIHVHTPPDQPDKEYTIPAPNLAVLLARNPELVPFLNSLMHSINPAWKMEFDQFSMAQLEPDKYEPPKGIEESVKNAVERLDSDDWRVRDRATSELLQTEQWLYLAMRGDRLNRGGLTAEQNVRIDYALSKHPVLTEKERQVLQRLVKENQ